MKTISSQTFDEERCFYDVHWTKFENCRFDGPHDGESPLKECQDVVVDHCFFNLRYPFWHDVNLQIRNCELTPLCRAALWYDKSVEIFDSKLHGIKAIRECSDVRLKGCDIDSPEFGWSTNRMIMENCTASAEYFMMRSQHLSFRNVKMKGKYSFQYITNSVFENCEFDTKDAFWHGKNILVRNCIVKGEYLAWYAENITFDHCTIIGTQPLCYCKNLRLIDCVMQDTDLSFERSEVMATLTAPIESIKNPLSGVIRVPAVNDLIFDLPEAKGKVIVGNEE
ncbi:MAG: DUF3737 family protein [Allobaculum sp.]|nr:DUF3737 family protein [Allobaculum sp.]